MPQSYCIKYYLTMEFIKKYVYQQVTNIINLLSIINVFITGLHTASNFALSIYVIITLILITHICIKTIFIYYDKILYIPQTKISKYTIILFLGTFIKKYVLFTNGLLVLNKFSKELLSVIIHLILFIIDCLKQCISTLKKQHISDLIITIVSIKFAYTILKTCICNITKIKIKILCETINEIAYLIITHLPEIIILILALYLAGLCIKHNSQDFAPLSEHDIEQLNAYIERQQAIFIR